MKQSNERNVAVWLVASGIYATTLISSHAAFEWANITHNGNPDISGQLQMTITKGSGNEVDFTFRNNGAVDSVITGIYFDPGATFQDHVSVVGGNARHEGNWIEVSSSGVSFDYDHNANFPGGNSLAAPFQTALGVLANHPSPWNGINDSTSSSRYEWLTLRLLLDNNGSSWNDLLNAVNSGEFRVGLHVQSIGGKSGSDSYVTAPVPEPTTVLAGALLLLPFGVSTIRFLMRRAGPRIKKGRVQGVA